VDNHTTLTTEEVGAMRPAVQRSAIAIAERLRRRANIVRVEEATACANQIESFPKNVTPPLTLGEMVQRTRRDYRVKRSVNRF